MNNLLAFGIITSFFQSGYSITAIMSVFQTEDTGSIPVIRSKLYYDYP